MQTQEAQKLVASLALQQVKEASIVTTQKEINTEYKILTYISLALTFFGIVMFTVLHYGKSKAVQIMHFL